MMLLLEEREIVKKKMLEIVRQEIKHYFSNGVKWASNYPFKKFQF